MHGPEFDMQDEPQSREPSAVKRHNNMSMDAASAEKRKSLAARTRAARDGSSSFQLNHEGLESPGQTLETHRLNT